MKGIIIVMKSRRRIYLRFLITKVTRTLLVVFVYTGNSLEKTLFTFGKIFALIYIYLETHKNKDSLIESKTNFAGFKYQARVF